MEIGSFIELRFEKGREYYSGENTLRLNSGRAAILHAFKTAGCNRLLLPVYQCPSVGKFLKDYDIKIDYYNIDCNFKLLIDSVPDDTAILIVNYFGIFSNAEMQKRISGFKNIIVDNCPAFYSQPLKNCINVYSTRKFFGVPDGAYVIGNNVTYNADYPQDYSSETSSFLLKRIEFGCSEVVYSEREQNEHRLDTSGVRLMSKLTHTILDSLDYNGVKKIRRSNFEYAKSLFDAINEIDVSRFYGEDCVPMVYPLMIRDNTLLRKLLDAKHFQGNWWKYICSLPYANDFEKDLSAFMIPITIDQRYNSDTLDFLSSIIYGK